MHFGFFEILFLVTVFTLWVFFYRFMYIQSCQLQLWGVYLLIDVIFSVTAYLTYKFALTSLSLDSSLFIFRDVFLIIQLGLVMLVFRNHYPVNDKVLLLCLALYMCVWMTERIMMGAESNSLHMSSVFLRTLVVLGVWVYFFYLYSKPHVSMFSVPFFWIALGWLVYFGITGAAFIPQIATKVSEIEKQQLGTFHVTVEIISVCLYAIGFWKTKKWVKDYSWNEIE